MKNVPFPDQAPRGGAHGAGSPTQQYNFLHPYKHRQHFVLNGKLYLSLHSIPSFALLTHSLTHSLSLFVKDKNGHFLIVTNKARKETDIFLFLFNFFFKMGQSRPLFVYFCSFLVTISIQIEKSIDGVLGIWTRGHRMVDADETTELWRPPDLFKF